MLQAGERVSEKLPGRKGSVVFSLEKRSLREHLITLYNCLREGCSEVGVGPFSQITSDRTRGNGNEFRQWSFRLSNGKSFIEWVVKHWRDRLSREVGKSPFLEVFKRHVDGALRDMV